MGRRTAKINLSSKRIKRFLWDGNVPLHEWEYDLSERPSLSRDKDNLLVYDKEEPVTENLITWVFDENSFVPAAKLVGDKSYSILTDHLGTPYEAYDENGEKVWARELDIYGNAIAGDSSFIPFLYQGQYYDEEIGLAYNHFRYYSPDSGTYISQDPIRLAGNNPNIYAYVFDSNIQVDVFGLDLKPENGYLRGKKHGIKVTDKDAQIYANKEGISYGKWGSKKDLEIAGSLAETLEVGVFQDFPVNADSKSVVFHSGGSIDEIVQYPATHYRLRNNGNGTFHGFPIDETAEPIRTGNTNLNTNSH